MKGFYIMKKLTTIFFLFLLSGALLLCGCSNTSDTETEMTGTELTETEPETEPVPEEIVVTYEEFGAVGDGVTDDFASIIAAHAYANENNLKVRAKDDAIYYIGASTDTAVIQTNTDWGTAQFIIDDRNLEDISVEVFKVTSKIPSYNIDLTTLAKNQENLGITLDQYSAVQIMDKNTYRFYRVGKNQKSVQQDIILVNPDGTIDPNTPVVWDYETITSAVVFPIPEDTLYLNGGIFTTLSPDVSPEKYIQRGVQITRSNTVIDGLAHYITEGATGIPYNGFLDVDTCANILVKNVILTAHMGPDGSLNSSYDLLLTAVANITFDTVSQSNDIHDETLWGISGTNFCNNVIFENCTLNRIDAHRGINNLTVRNCTLGIYGIGVVGFGTMCVENSTIYRDHFITLRTDYGCSWDGDVIIRNCTWIPPKDTSELSIFYGESDESFDTGFECHLTNSLTIEGLHIVNSEEQPYVYAFANPATYYYDKASYRVYKHFIVHTYVMPETVSLSGITLEYTMESGDQQIFLSPNSFIFKRSKTEFFIDGVQQDVPDSYPHIQYEY